MGVSLGIKGEHTSFDLLAGNATLEDCAVPIRDNLEIITSNETLATAEIRLDKLPEREGALRRALITERGEWDFDCVILDCAPALSLLNQNALAYVDEVIVPVSCDYLALVGVRQVMKTLERMGRVLKREVAVRGVLPTFYDGRTRISQEVVRQLTEFFHEKVLPPIRHSTKLKEAPAFKKTIFEYAPDSTAAEDYLAVVEKLLV